MTVHDDTCRSLYAGNLNGLENSVGDSPCDCGAQKPTWTQPVCEAHWLCMYPGRVPYRAHPSVSADLCCFCNDPANIYVHLDPATVPYPRVLS